MRLFARTTWALCAAALALGAASQAAAAEPVKLEVLTAHLTKTGTAVAPELKRMQADFKQRFAYTNYALVGRNSLTIAEGQTTSVSLPNGKQAQITFVKRNKNAVDIKVSVLPATMTLSITPGGETYYGLGAHQGGDLFLLIKR